MKLAVVDDEKKATDLLECYVKRFEDENNIRIELVTYHNPVNFLEEYRMDYDLILMDVEMPGLNGIETAKELRRMDSQVILMFITNMTQYAIHGYEVEAVDYVIKPVTYADFDLKLQKALRYIVRNQNEKITLKLSDSIVSVFISEIYYIEIDQHYLIYYTMQGEYRIRGVMKEVELQMLEHHFVRIHHCYLVNLKYIEAIKGHTVRVAGKELQISRNKKAEFLSEFARYVGGMKL